MYLIVLAALGGVLSIPAQYTVPLYVVAILIGGARIFLKAFGSVRRLDLDMNVLMSVAVIGAAILGEWFEGAAVVSLFSLAELLEARSMRRARGEIGKLLDLAPPIAVVRRRGYELELPADKVEIGETVLVKPGQRIPVDGVVSGGASEVNQAPITGESKMVDRYKGDEVFAGTLNGSGFLEITSTHRAQDTVLSRIIHLVEQAQESRAPVQRTVERFARIYTPLVIVAALLVFLLPPLLQGGAWADWFYRALVLLVIACPCALVISTPVAIITGLTAAARSGVLIKGGSFLEALGKIDAMALDKTGTLTFGEPRLTDVIPLTGMRERELMLIAAALEKRSEHPLARAIRARAMEMGLAVPDPEQFKSIPGLGAHCVIEGQGYTIGSHRMLHNSGLCNKDLHKQVEHLELSGNSVLLLSSEQEPLAILLVSDNMRPEAPRAMQELKRAGIKRLALLTGDNQESAEGVAYNAGIDEIYSNLLPEDKLEQIYQLKRRYHMVGMVGDGVNDAPALAASSVGFAMGAAGTDVAIESADVALLSDDLFGLARAVRLGRRTLTVIRQNVALAIGIKAVVFALALLGVATLWLAVLADMGASLLVVANSLKLIKEDNIKP